VHRKSRRGGRNESNDLVRSRDHRIDRGGRLGGGSHLAEPRMPGPNAHRPTVHTDHPVWAITNIVANRAERHVPLGSELPVHSGIGGLAGFRLGSRAIVRCEETFGSSSSLVGVGYLWWFKCPNMWTDQMSLPNTAGHPSPNQGRGPLVATGSSRRSSRRMDHRFGRHQTRG
jgi:hypothetical protein